MLKAKHHIFVYPFFQYYTLYLLKRKFYSVNIIGDFTDENKAVLLIANHVSWWDGFWAMYLKLKRLKRKFYFMMQEDQLLRFQFFNKTGAFSINKNSREIIQSLHYAASILDDRENMLLMYPQGNIYSIYEDEFSFEQGIERILLEKKDKIQFVFSVNLVDYFSHSKPTLNIYIKTYKGKFAKNEIEKSYNEFYKQTIAAQKQSISE